MTEQEYCKKLTEIDKEMHAKKKALAVEYALSNNPYKEGDIVQDVDGVILKIECIRPIMGYCTNPQCAYTGILLTQKLAPMKKQKVTAVYQSRIVRKIEL